MVTTAPAGTNDLATLQTGVTRCARPRLPPARHQTPNPTALLLAWQNGSTEALGELVPLVHDELRRLARRYMGRERRDHTLQATALVNEAYLKLIDVKVSWQNRAHFFAVAARVMRRILVDFARARDNAKRGGGRKVTLDEAMLVLEQPRRGPGRAG